MGIETLPGGATRPETDGDSVVRSSKVPAARPRLDSIDELRGLVMVLMALDHVRDFLSSSQIDPTDLSQTTPALFLTRWVTHFCAPVFIFLAGTGAYLAAARGKTKPQLAYFLLTRGLWIVVLELTVARLGWTFNVNYRFTGCVVLWAIGWSMVGLAGLVFLPTGVVTAFGVALILLHNLADGIPPQEFGRFAWLWEVLHAQGLREVWPDVRLAFGYPLVPWVGVMAAGYGFGTLYRLAPAVRRKWLVALGVGLIAAFVALRATNWYGDPRPWVAQAGPGFTVLSFLNCWKYPPSLLYLLMTLGPALLALALFERGAGPLGRRLVVFGRVPMFYYLLHLPLIHAIAYGLTRARGESTDWLFDYPPGHAAQGHGISLPAVYGVWLVVLVLLYPVCSWFAGVKQRHRAAWLSYF